MAKKQRSSEGESIPLAPEVSAPPVAHDEVIDLTCGGKKHVTLAEFAAQIEEPPLPTVHGHGMTQAFTSTGKWVAYRVSSAGDIDVLTPKGKGGAILGESKHSAAARLLKAVTEAYR